MIRTVEISCGPLRAELLSLGATLRRLEVADRTGASANIVLGCRDPEAYRSDSRFLGSTIGRYANRIAGARFLLDGREHRLPANDGRNTLHGGTPGFDRRDWVLEDADAASARFSLISPAGENGFPGTLRTTATYAMEADGLAIVLAAETDAPTVVNLTNHAYFNLAGEASGRTILDHWLQIRSRHVTPVDPDLIPTGAPHAVDNTPFDFRSPKQVGKDIARDDAQLVRGMGYDHNWVLDAPGPAATLYDPESGRVLEVHTTKPGLQFYSGNHLAGGPPGTSGAPYAARGGLCLEPQYFPDTPNQPDFPSARLDPSQRYEHRMTFRFRTAKTLDEAFPA